MRSARTKSVLPARVDEVASVILALRGRRVILDTALATLYGVTTKRLNEQVKRNASRFPRDFVFRLSRTEVDTLNRSQIATGSQKHRDPRFAPLAFTEHGAIMAATILSSQRAVGASAVSRTATRSSAARRRQKKRSTSRTAATRGDADVSASSDRLPRSRR